MHVAPLLLAYALLGLWFAVGTTILFGLGFRSNRLQIALLAPAVGLACCVLPIFWLSLAGLPVLRFARPLTAVLMVVGATGLVVWGRLLPWKALAIFVVPVVLSMLAVGSPLLDLGSGWMAYANDDWANYNLAAIRFMREGFLTPPDVNAIRDGTNYPDLYWFMHVADGSRPGSELLLAWVASVFHANPFRIFMAVITGLHGALLTSAVAFALPHSRARPPALAGLALLAASPLLFHGTVHQLIAQNFGLALAIALATLTLVPITKLFQWRSVLMAPFLLAAALIVYPEVVPVFGAAFLVFQIVTVRVWARKLTRMHVVAAIGMLLVLILFCGTYLINVTGFLLRQAQHALTAPEAQPILFPFYLVPSGVADFWGLQLLGQLPSEPYLSFSIGLGLLLFVALACAIIFGIRRRFPPAFAAGVMALLAIQLAVGHGDFGLFKLAMYAQPLIFFTIMTLLWSLCRERVLLATTAGLFGIVLAYFSATQVADSMSASNGSPQWLSLPLGITPSADTECSVAFDTPSTVEAKIQSSLVGCARSFWARDHFPNLAFSGNISAFGGARTAELAKADTDLLTPRTVPLTFRTAEGGLKVEVKSTPVIQVTSLGVSPRAASVIGVDQRNYKPDFLVLANASNFLIYTNSTVGEFYYLPDHLDDISYYQPEQDFYFPDRKIAALGKHLVFRVVNPSRQFRMVLSISASLTHDGACLLPPASLSGSTIEDFNVTGRGSARLVSPPLEALSTEGGFFVLLNLGEDLHQFKTPTQGMMGLFGTGLSLDYRRFTAFGRDVALIDAADYDPANKPQALQRFPSDLADPRLEYSGIYEDGWVGERAFIALAGKQSANRVVVRGEIPHWAGLGSSEVTLRVNDGPAVSRTIHEGTFEIEAPASQGRQEIRLTFEKLFSLPAGDDRPAAALLKSVVIE